MGSPQEADFVFGEHGGDRLVGRQHEFFDDLVALVVLGQMSACDPPVAGELDLHFGQGKFQRAAVLPAVPQDHRQLEHLPQHRRNLGRDAGMRSCRLFHHRQRLFVGKTIFHLDGGACESLPGQDALGVEVQDARSGCIAFVRPGGWPGRSRGFPEASGSPGPAGKRSFRGCVRRDRAWIRSGTKWATSAIWTPRLQCPFSSRESEIASSKSRAFAGSIVTASRRRSSRLPISVSSKSRACSRASSRTASSNVSGILKARMMLRVSTPGCRAAEDLDYDPFALLVRRRVLHDLDHDLVARLAPLAPGSPTEIGSWNVVPSTLTKLVAPASK